jgi:uncharacterized protein YuzE
MTRASLKNQLTFQYDHTTDTLSISSGQPINTDTIGLDENVIVHVEPQTGTVVGLTILDFMKRFVNRETPASVPIAATFEPIKQRKPRKAKR